MKTAVIIHGTKGSPQGNWFQDVALHLTKLGYQCLVPQFPTPDGQELDNWCAHFDATVGALDHEAILIGHSVGAVFVLRLLERRNDPIAAAALVAGFTAELGLPEYDRLNETFVAAPFHWGKIRSNAHCILCISGEKDPYVPLEQGKEIADSLGAKHIVIRDGGHLNAESGYTTFPQLIEELINSGVLGQNTAG